MKASVVDESITANELIALYHLYLYIWHSGCTCLFATLFSWDCHGIISFGYKFERLMIALFRKTIVTGCEQYSHVTLVSMRDQHFYIQATDALRIVVPSDISMCQIIRWLLNICLCTAVLWLCVVSLQYRFGILCLTDQQWYSFVGRHT